MRTVRRESTLTFAVDLNRNSFILGIPTRYPLHDARDLGLCLHGERRAPQEISVGALAAHAHRDSLGFSARADVASSAGCRASGGEF